jgi:tetratricopeptide (TPR) repeat protein
LTRRQLLFRLAAVAFVPLLLLLAELGLRASEPPQPRLELPQGWGEQTRVVSPGGRERPLEAYTTPEGEARVRTSQAMLDGRFMHPLDYSVQRPEEVFRVFCFGGSATLGVPVEATPEQTFPGQLQAQLEAAGVRAEVINLGGASFGSDRVVELMALAVTHQPSALVVYSANNEFFEYALALHQRNLQQAEAVLERRSGLRLVRWLWGITDHARGGARSLPAPEDLEQRQQALVRTAVELELTRDASAAPVQDGDHYHRRDTPYRDVVSRYTANLARMVALADGVAPLVLVVVPANLAQAPFQAVHRRDMSQREIDAWERDVALAEARLGQGDRQGAVALLDQAIERDPTHATAHFLRGQARLAEGDQRLAARDLQAALELDIAPGRPVAAQAEAVRALADPPRVLVVDPSPSFDAYGIATGGSGYFHDACHLTPQGYAVLARHISRALLSAGIAPSPSTTPADGG